MTDLEYFEQAERVLASIELACDSINEQTDADLDSQRTGNMVTLTFSNRSQIIINLQKPLQEIWMAAKSGGYHYKYTSRLWLDTKSGREFFDDLSRCSSEQSGGPLLFSA
ncbi:MAG: iron donor protein CyaY [Polaromonas sp.]|nr:iron donor protein CyaY [Polaromonas sp.]